MLSFKKLLNSFKFALKGISYVFKNEQNFRIQVFIGILVLIFIVLLPVEKWQIIILLLMITMVLVLEIINTIFEKIVDLLKPRLHSYVEIIKDMMSAAVLLAYLVASIIGLLIFVPYLLDLI